MKNIQIKYRVNRAARRIAIAGGDLYLLKAASKQKVKLPLSEIDSVGIMLYNSPMLPQPVDIFKGVEQMEQMKSGAADLVVKTKSGKVYKQDIDVFDDHVHDFLPLMVELLEGKFVGVGRPSSIAKKMRIGKQRTLLGFYMMIVLVLGIVIAAFSWMEVHELTSVPHPTDPEKQITGPALILLIPLIVTGQVLLLSYNRVFNSVKLWRFVGFFISLIISILFYTVARPMIPALSSSLMVPVLFAWNFIFFILGGQFIRSNPRLSDYCIYHEGYYTSGGTNPRGGLRRFFPLMR